MVEHAIGGLLLACIDRERFYTPGNLYIAGIPRTAGEQFRL
jgi:hypothetical protein